MLVGNVFQQSYSIVDSVIVGRAFGGGGVESAQFMTGEEHMQSDDRIVYSSGPEGTIICPNCGRSPCECPEGLAGDLRKRTQTEPVRVSFRRGCKGSGLTLVEKLPMHPAGKEELLKKFKKRLGVGGTVKQGVLELQGDHRAFVKAELEAAGYKVKAIQ